MAIHVKSKAKLPGGVWILLPLSVSAHITCNILFEEYELLMEFESLMVKMVRKITNYDLDY